MRRLAMGITAFFRNRNVAATDGCTFPRGWIG
jgi:hypothetical protein